MATYLPSKEIKITRLEGNTGDIEFTVPSVIDMSEMTEVIFLVKAGSTTVMDKRLSDDEITVDGQLITISLAESDTLGKSSGRWELEVSATGITQTLGRGDFEILKKLIK